MRHEMRRWSIARRSDKTLTDLALMFNVVLQGWINYYGRFYKSMLYPVFRHFNDTLVRWAMRNTNDCTATKSERGSSSLTLLDASLACSRTGALACAPTAGRWEPVSGDVHAGFCERRRVRSPPATLLVVLVSGIKAQAEALKVDVAAVGVSAVVVVGHHRLPRLGEVLVEDRAGDAS